MRILKVKHLMIAVAVILNVSVAHAITASPNYTQITTTTGKIIDSKLNTWTLGLGSTGYVYENGVQDATSSNVIRLVLLNNVMYKKNKMGQWYSRAATATSWVATTNPLHQSPSGTVSPNTITDSGFNVWTTSSGLVYENGAQYPGSLNVNLLLYYYGIVYQRNTSNNWYAFYGTGFTKVAGDPRVTNVFTAPTLPVVATNTTTSRSIKNYYGAKCNGTDDSAAVIKAFDAATNGGFTLVIDCAVTININEDIAHVIFIGDNTTVSFSQGGKFIVNNVNVPAFAIMNSSNITLTNWQIEYSGSMPVAQPTGYYYVNGVKETNAGYTPASAFNTLTATPYMTSAKGVKFTGVQSEWENPTNTSAVFFLTGSTSHVTFNGLNVYVPQTTGPSGFVPVVFSFNENYKSNQSVTAATPSNSSTYRAIPTYITVENVNFDGTIMGFVGNLQNSTFSNIKSYRYSDLQDSAGANVGGIGKWFAPPHLFYISYTVGGDTALYNTNLTFENITDFGQRLGVARDLSTYSTAQSKFIPVNGSGYLASFKLGCVTCTVTNYTSYRPDGALVIYPSTNVTYTNFTGTYNSEFINHLYWGIEYAANPYDTVTLKNVTITDLAQDEFMTILPVPAATSTTDLMLSNVNLNVNNYVGPGVLTSAWPTGIQAAGSMRTYTSINTGVKSSINYNNAISTTSP